MQGANRRTYIEFVAIFIFESFPDLRQGEIRAVKALKNIDSGKEQFVAKGSFYIWAAAICTPAA